jgi:hypothetical protein
VLLFFAITVALVIVPMPLETAMLQSVLGSPEVIAVQTLIAANLDGEVVFSFTLQGVG